MYAVLTYYIVKRRAYWSGNGALLYLLIAHLLEYRRKSEFQFQWNGLVEQKWLFSPQILELTSEVVILTTNTGINISGHSEVTGCSEM